MEKNTIALKTKRWKRFVKDKLWFKERKQAVLQKKTINTKNLDHITADFYSKRHSFLDRLLTEQVRQIALDINSKTTENDPVTKQKRDCE